MEHQPNAGSGSLVLVVMLVYSNIFCFAKKFTVSASVKAFGSTSFQDGLQHGAAYLYGPVPGNSYTCA